MMNRLEALRSFKEALRREGIEEYDAEARIALSAFLGVELYELMSDKEIPEDTETRIAEAVKRRAAGEPMAKSRELTTDEWIEAIEKLKKAGVPMVTFTGGEPTQREDLCRLVDSAKWFVTRLNTNGVLLSRPLCEQLKAASLDSVQITLYSHDEDIHNRLVGSTHFADTVQGIRNALAAGLDVSVNTPLCHANKDYESTLSFLKDLGVRFVTLSGLILTGSAAETTEKQLTEEALFAIVE